MNNAPIRTIKDVVTDFLGTAPSLEEIAAYRLPDNLQQRAQQLLDKNRAGTLSEEERHEIEDFRQIDHLLMLVKAKARIRSKARES
jgi:hypothetical protein